MTAIVRPPSKVACIMALGGRRNSTTATYTRIIKGTTKEVYASISIERYSFASIIRKDSSSL